MNKYVETAWADLENILNNADSNLKIKITDPENVVLGYSGTSGTLGNLIKSYTGEYLIDFTPSDFSEAKYTDDSTRLFEDCTKLSGICKLPSSITNAFGMFWKCMSLTNIDTSAFTNVAKAVDMFNSCTKLSSIDTSIFKNLTDATAMFSNCTSLTGVDTSGFTNVTKADSMFNDCKGLTSIDTTAFTKVTTAKYMFYGCTGLTSIDTSAFANVADADSMFYYCTGLKNLNTSGFTRLADSFDNDNDLFNYLFFVQDEYDESLKNRVFINIFNESNR